MSETDRELLIRGLEKAEYNTLRMKTMLNEMVVQLYHEPVPAF